MSGFDFGFRVRSDPFPQSFSQDSHATAAARAASPGEPLDISVKDFEWTHDSLGTCSFGEVWKVIKKSSNDIYAMKVINKCDVMKDDGNDSIEKAIQERTVLSQMHHPFIVRLQFAFQDQTVSTFIQLNVLFSYCSCC